jgi:RNA polymerase sigma factor (sigma-70 family)
MTQNNLLLLLILVIAIELALGFRLNQKSILRNIYTTKSCRHQYSQKESGLESGLSMLLHNSQGNIKLNLKTIERNNRLSSTRLFANPRKIDVGGDGTGFAKELLKHTLLNASDEFDLSKQYKLGAHIRATRTSMEAELGRLPTDAEVANTFKISEAKVKILVDNSEAAKKILVRANMRLVFHISRYYRYRGVSYPDLVQEGTFGLIKAVDKYDPDKGFRFSTYASWWIKQSVSRAIAEKSRIVRLPVHIHDMMVSISKVERQFMSSHGRKPTSQELAERLALPIQKVELLIKCARDVNSIDQDIFQNRGKMSSGGEVQVKDRIQSQSSTPYFLNEKTSVRAEVWREIKRKGLTAR